MQILNKLRRGFSSDGPEQQIQEANRLLTERYRKNARILADFPWLWAVRQRWELATDSVQVTDSKTFHLSTQIAVEMNHQHQRIPRLFAHLSRSLNGRPMEWVEQVWGGEINRDALTTNPQMTWDELLKTYHQRSVSVTVHHVVVVQNDPENMYVIKPMRPFKSFNDIWAWHSVCH